MADDESLRYGSLPVRVVASRILNYLKYSPDFIESILHEIDANNFHPEIGYDNGKKRIGTIAEIDDFGNGFEIRISEPYLAFLWCLSHTLVFIYYNRNIKESTEPYKRTINLLFYGLSLFIEWSDWPQDLPNPEHPNPNDEYMDKANWIMTFAALFIFYHEYAHQYLGHVTENHTSYEERKQDEFTADSFSVSCVLDAIKIYNPELLHTGKIAIIVGICSILFESRELEGDDDHPDTDQRIAQIVNKIADNDQSEYWVCAIQMLHLWGLIYHKRVLESPVGITPKEHFVWLAGELKGQY